MTPAPAPPTVLDPVTSAVASAYAVALLDNLGDEEGEPVEAELAELAAAYAQVPGLGELLTAEFRPAAAERFVEKVFAPRVSEATYALLVILARHGRLGLLPAVARACTDERNRRSGKVPVEVVSAVALDEQLEARIAEQLAAALGRPCVLTSRVDTKLLGGLTVTVGEQTYDASVATSLKRLRRRLADRAGGLAPVAADDAPAEPQRPTQPGETAE